MRQYNFNNTKRSIRAALVIVCLFSMHLSAQPYISVIDNVTAWNVADMTLDVQTDSIYYTGIEGIEGQMYHIYTSEFGNTFRLRENEDHSMLLELTDTGQERVVMNLNLTESDSFFYCADVGIYLQVDSIHHDDMDRKIITFDQSDYVGSEPMRFVEGIGPSVSPFVPDCSFNFYMLLCAYNEETCLYYNDYFGACRVTIGYINRQNSNTAPHLFPVPTSSRLTLQANRLEDGHYAIADQQGVIQLAGAIRSGEVTIDVSTLSKGVYIIKAIWPEKAYAFVFIVN